jgi:hypothetical protein
VNLQARVTVNYEARPSELLEAVMKPAIKEIMEPVKEEVVGDWESSVYCRYERRIETLGLMLADALFGQKYPIHLLMLLQELAWHIIVFQVVHQSKTMMKNLVHFQDVIDFVRTQQQRDLAKVMQLESARLAVQKLGYDSWDILREDNPKGGCPFWVLVSQARERVYSVLTPSGEPSQARNSTLQDDLAMTVSKAHVTCGYELGDGFIQKRGAPTFVNSICDRVYRVCIESSPDLQVLMRKGRNDYDPNSRIATKWWSEDYMEALDRSHGPWSLWVVGIWKRRIGLVGSHTY